MTIPTRKFRRPPSGKSENTAIFSDCDFYQLYSIERWQKTGTSSNCNAVTQNVSQTQSNQFSNIVTGDDRWFLYIEPVNKFETKFCELLIVEGLFLPKKTIKHNEGSGVEGQKWYR